MILDPNFTHESLTFKTQEEFENYGLNLEKVGAIRVNSALYTELSHAFDPIEIHMLDMNRSIVIDNTKYRADREAIHSIDLNNNGSLPTLEVYYGLSGEDDLKEIEMVHSYRNRLEELERYTFKNPRAKELYDEFVQNYSEEDVIDLSSGEVRARCDSGSTGCNFSYYTFKAGDGTPYIVKYRNSPTGTIFSAEIRWFLWNKSYRKGIRPRAQGGTITEINRLHDSLGWRELPENDDPIGYYHENGAVDTSRPKVYVKVKTPKSTETKTEYRWKCRKSKVSRGDGNGTESWHRASIRLNSNNYADLIIDDIYIP